MGARGTEEGGRGREGGVRGRGRWGRVGGWRGGRVGDAPCEAQQCERMDRLSRRARQLRELVRVCGCSRQNSQGRHWRRRPPACPKGPCPVGRGLRPPPACTPQQPAAACRVPHERAARLQAHTPAPVPMRSSRRPGSWRYAPSCWKTLRRPQGVVQGRAWACACAHTCACMPTCATANWVHALCAQVRVRVWVAATCAATGGGGGT